jgi:hypothetical protein
MYWLFAGDTAESSVAVPDRFDTDHAIHLDIETDPDPAFQFATDPNQTVR